MEKFDNDGYDKNGFNRQGIHKETGTRYDLEGMDCQGFDEKGFNKYGYNRLGMGHNATHQGRYDLSEPIYEKNPEEDDKYDLGKGVHRKNIRGFLLINGRNVYTKEHYDKRGFTLEGINIETGTKYNKYGYDYYGWNENGYNEWGFNREGIHEYTGTRYDFDGYDMNHIDRRGFVRFTGKHRITGTKYDEKGFNKRGLWHGDNVYSKTTGFNVNGWNEQGINETTGTKYDINGYDIDGFNEEGYTSEGFDKYGVDRNGINKDTKQKDERIIFAETFIASKKSIEQFARDANIPQEVVSTEIEKIRNSPCIKERIDQAFKANSDRFIGIHNTQKEELLAGKKSIKDIRGISIILRLCDENERTTIQEMLIRQMAKHDISIMQYRNIFGINNIDAYLPHHIKEGVEVYNSIAKKSQNKEIRMLGRELYKEIDRIKAYQKPYRPSDIERLGYMKDGKEIIVDVNDEIRQSARKYLFESGEFICSKTMDTTMMKIIKGELDVTKGGTNEKQEIQRSGNSETERDRDEFVAEVERLREELAEKERMLAQLRKENEQSRDELSSDKFKSEYDD